MSAFCAQLSREQNDPLAGSAAHVAKNLLLSWPRAKWTRNLRHAKDMDTSLVDALDALAAQGRRVNLVQQPGMATHRHSLILMPERRRFSIPRAELLAFLSAWQTNAPLDEWEDSPLHHDMLLCCTHGKKDKCCAKFGYRTYKALAQTIADHQLPFDVWESSHLGGCRLAASLIFLSPIRKYGRIDPAQALPLLESEARGERYLPGYRGNSAFTAAQQCAEVALLEHVSTPSHQPTLTLLNDEGDEQERITLWRVSNMSTPMVVHCRASTIMRIDTCSDLEQGPTASIVWQAMTLKHA